MSIPVTDSQEPSPIVFIGKRFYTNRDALLERFGRIFHLPHEWAKAGQSVILWLIDYHSRTPIHCTVDSLKINSTPILSMAAIRAMLATLTTRPAAIIASGDCYIGLLGWVLSRLTGALFVFDVYDKYDEFSGYRKPLGLDLFAFLRQRADLTFYASRALAARLTESTDATAVVMVINGVDPEMFHAADLRASRRSLQLDPDWTIIAYFGAMEPDRGVSDLIAAIELLRSSGMDLKLLVCGKPHPETPLHRDWIIARGMVPHDQIPTYIGAANLLVIPYRLSDFMDMGASCKIAEFLMCERPLVSTRTPNFTANFPDQARELHEALCTPANPADIARAISLQLRQRMVASKPQGLTWPEISRHALDAVSRRMRKNAGGR